MHKLVFRKRTKINTMKKVIGIACIILLTQQSFAQIEKGNYMVGSSLGRLSYNVDAKIGSVYANPSVGIFLSDGWVVGASMPISAVVNQTYNFFSYGFGVFSRKYFNTESTLPYFLGGNTSVSRRISNTSFANINLNGGMVYFLSENVGIEGILNVGNYLEFSNIRFRYPNISLNFGLQIYLNRNNLSKNNEEF
jgi:hypothetical protein